MPVPPTVPRVLVFGPSGVGKSSLGDRLAWQFNFHHREIDRYPADGIDLEGLRPEWDAFFYNREAQPLSQVVAGRASACGFTGVVLTFPGNLVPSSDHLSAALAVGMTPIVLYGSAAECIAAFKAREATNGRGLNVNHWRKHNRASHPAFEADYFKPFRVQAFEAGSFRDAIEIAEEVMQRTG